MPTLAARVLHRPDAAHRWLPEGPKLLADGRIAWITIQCGGDARHGALHVFDPRRGDDTAWELPGRPGFVHPLAPGDSRFVLGMERAVGVFDCRDRSFAPIVDGIDADVTGTIVNDGIACRGGIVFGTKDTEFRERKAGLWFLRLLDRRLFALRRDQLCSNGKVVRDLPAGRIELFDVDSPTRTVVRYELDPATGACSEPQLVVDLRHERAVPDGMVAGPGADEVTIAMFDPGPATHGRALVASLRDGAVVRTFTTPGAAQVTCPLWLPTAHGRRLVLTTAAENLTAAGLAAQPDAGCLFATDELT
jgi:sugar lactone lactonase YvrE